MSSIGNKKKLLVSNSLRSNVIWSFGGMLIYMGCQWGMLSCLTKMLSMKDVGEFVFALAICTPIITLASMGTRYVLVTAKNDEEYKICDFLGHRTFFLGFSILLVLPILMYLYSSVTTIVISVVFVAKSIESFSDVLYADFQKHERMDYVSLLRIIKGGVSLICFGVVTYIFRDLVLSVLAMMLAWLFCASFIDLPLYLRLMDLPFKTIIPKFNTSHLWSLSKLGASIGVAMTLGSLFTNIPRFFIKELAGDSYLAVFSAIGYFLLVGNVIIDSLNRSALPRLANLYNSSDIYAYRKLCVRILLVCGGIGVCGLIGAVVVGKPIMSYAYTPEYAKYSGFLRWMMFYGLISSLVTGLRCMFLSMRKFNYILIWDSVGILLLVVFCYVFIAKYQLMGAVYALLVAVGWRGMVDSYWLIHSLRTKALPERYGT